jgi:hypothetical protein
VKTLTTGFAALVFAGAAYAAVQTATQADDGRRKASFSCWWSPGERTATVGWRFGGQPPGSEIVSDVTRNAPFARKSGSVHAGETVHVTITFAPGQPLTGPGLRLSCVIVAGANVVPFGETDHSGVNKTVRIA